jgi:transposase
VAVAGGRDRFHIAFAVVAYMLDGIDWRNPRHTFRPQRAG